MPFISKSATSICVALSFTAVIATFTSCKSGGGNEQSVVLNGAGSSFVYPAMSRWTHDFTSRNPGVQINYQSIGSGGGVEQVRAGTVDVGASDYGLNDEDLSKMKPVLQIPESAGPVCVTYNLPGLSQPLQLSANSLAGIFLGKIKSWQDPLIQKDNPGVKLPSTPIVVSHRTDGSGTTAAFTTYLSAVSDEWKSKVGQGASVSWPIGLGGKGKPLIR